MNRTSSKVKRLNGVSALSAEAPLLLALAVGPSLMVPFGEVAFEYPKALLLWAMASASLALALGGRDPRLPVAPSFGPVPIGTHDRFRLGLLTTTVVIAALALLVSILASSAPAFGWSGSPLRRLGGGTELALLAVLVLTASFSTMPASRQRILFAAAAGSVVPTFLGLLQSLGLDPLNTSVALWQRPGSTLGNPLLFAGYLIVALPLTLAAAMDEVTVATRWLWILAAFQIAALAAARASGPLAALLVAAGVGGTMIAASRGLRIPVRAAASVLAAAALVGIVAGPRIARASAGTLGVRALLWQAAGSSVEAEPRHLPVGWGPEAITQVITRHADQSLRRIEGPNVAPDRAHNQTLDTLLGFGVVGLVARLILVYLGLVAALSVSGLLPAADRVRFGTLAAVVTVLVSAAAWMAAGAWTLAFSVPGSVVIFTAVWTGSKRPLPSAAGGRVVVIVTILVAFLSHYFETQTGIATISSALLGMTALGVTIGAAADGSRPAAVRTPSMMVWIAAAIVASLVWYGGARLFEATDDRRFVQEAQALAAAADSTAEPLQRARLYGAASGQLDRAWRVNPYDYHHARNRGSLERRWARALPPAERSPHLEAAERWYSAAIELAPTAPILWEEWGNLALEHGRPDEALHRLDRSVALGLETSEVLKLADAALAAAGVEVTGANRTDKATEALRQRGYSALADRYDVRR